MPRPFPVPGVTATTSLTVAAPRILAVRLDELEHYRPRAMARTDPEDLHDLRVASRRLRAALALFGGPLAEARRGVKPFADALGEVRDRDVLVEWLTGALADARPGERAGIERLADAQRRELGPLEATMREANQRFETTLLPVLRLHLRAAGGDGTVGGAPIRRRLAERLRKLQRLVDRLPTTADGAAVHALRIAGKKVRYELELLEAPLGEAAATALRRVRQLQERIGELHDRDLRLALLPDWIAQAAPPDLLGAVRLLRDTLAERRRLATTLDDELHGWRHERSGEALAAALLGDRDG